MRSLLALSLLVSSAASADEPLKLGIDIKGHLDVIIHGLGGSEGPVTPPPSRCPYADTAATDGCAASLGGTIQHPDFFSSYALQSGQTYAAPFTGTISNSVLTVSGVPAPTNLTASFAKGATRISIPAGLSGIAAGLTVYDNTLATIIGVVSSYDSATGVLVLKEYTYQPSKGAGDALAFQVVTTGSETIQAPGIPAGVHITGPAGNGAYNLANAAGVAASGSMLAVHRPPWNVYGVEYPAGNSPEVIASHGGLVNPLTAETGTGWGKLPSACAVATDITNPVIKCQGSSASITLQGFDFSASGPAGVCVPLLFTSSFTGTATLDEDKWASVGPSDHCHAQGGNIGVSGNMNLVITYSQTDGDNINNPSQFSFLTFNSAGNLTVSYDSFVNISCRTMSGNSGRGPGTVGTLQIDHIYSDNSSLRICTPAVAPGIQHWEIMEWVSNSNNTTSNVYGGMVYSYNTAILSSQSSGLAGQAPGATALIYQTTGTLANQGSSYSTTITNNKDDHNTLVSNINTDGFFTTSTMIAWGNNFYTNSQVNDNFMDAVGSTYVLQCTNAPWVGGQVVWATQLAFASPVIGSNGLPPASGNFVMNRGGLPYNFIYSSNCRGS